MSKEAFLNIINTKNQENIHKAGIYIIKDKNDNIIYIGKAKILINRLRSYIQKVHNTKTSMMIHYAEKIEIQNTKNETEALILEDQMIKKWKPKYNILLKDDKQMGFISISIKHQFPAIRAYYGTIKNQKDNLYFGPFVDTNSMNEIMNVTRKTFQIRDCKDTVFSNRTRPCIQYDIKECTAPCVDKVSKQEYDKQIKESVNFLKGDYLDTIKSYQKAMQIASKNMNFELAASLRDKISLLQKFSNVPDGLNYINCDIVGYISDNSSNQCIIAIVSIRNRIKINSCKFNLQIPENIEIEEVIADFLEHFYIKNEMPETILLDSTTLQKKKLFSYLNEV